MKTSTIYINDNIKILRRLPTSSIDLVYLDPPFNSKRQFAAPIGSSAAGAAFNDLWSMDLVDEAWLGEIADTNPNLSLLIQSLPSKPDQAYLIYMAIRLLETHRLLTDTGSLYLHCDDTMSHSLKLVMDNIFGTKNYRNNIVWQRNKGNNNNKSKYPRANDHILFYGKTRQPVWNPPYIELQSKDQYNCQDNRGIYQPGPLTSTGIVATGKSGKPWRGVNPTDYNQQWKTPQGKMRDYIIKHDIIPNYHLLKGTHAILDALDAADLIHWTSTGRPQIKLYLEASAGTAVDDNWQDIDRLNRNKESHWLPYTKTLGTAGKNNSSLHQCWRHSPGPVLRVRYHLHSSRETPRAMDRHRHITQGWRLDNSQAWQRPWHILSQRHHHQPTPSSHLLFLGAKRSSTRSTAGKKADALACRTAPALS